MILFGGLVCTKGYAQGNLMIFPKRIVFEGAQISKDITLANTGQDTSRYAISWVNYRMTESGRFEKIMSPDPGQFFADQNVRYFPRTVTLAPNESQKIKLQLFRAHQLDDREYRSHLHFSPIKAPTPLGEEKPIIDSSRTITTKLEVTFGISIPVIIQRADAAAKASLTELDLENSTSPDPSLHLVIKREGNKSVYGDFKVTYCAPTGTKTQVGWVMGVAVYTPNPKRHFSIQLQNLEELNFNQGKLLVEYLSQESQGKPLAVSELDLSH